MKYLFVIAQKEEINFNLLKTHFKSDFVKTNKYSLINYNQNQYFFYISGIGKVNSVLTLGFVLEKKIKYIINIGVCGSLLNTMVNKIYLIQKCYYLDVDVTQFNYKLGQIPHEKDFFLTNPLFNQKIIDQYKLQTNNLGTMDSFAEYKNFSKQQKTFIKNNQIYLFDMECTALAHMCQKDNLKFNAIKLVSDAIKHDECFNQYKNNIKHLNNQLTKFIIDWIRTF